MVFSVERNPTPKSDDERAAILAAPGFGKHFTDHMVRIDFADGAWGEGRVVPYGPLTLDPATSALHYGQEIFEGLKAYRQPDGTIAAFRPDANAARFARSARRLAMAAAARRSCSSSRCRRWSTSTRTGCRPSPSDSLYFRPFMIATEVGLGVNSPSSSYTYLLIASPAGPYFTGGDQAGEGVAVDRVHPGRARRYRRGEVRRQLRGRLPRPGAGHGEGLRPGRVARRRRAPLGRGDGRHEPVLRVRVRAVGAASSRPR